MLRQFIQDSSHHLKTPVTILKTSRHLMHKRMELIEAIASEDASTSTRIGNVVDKCKRQFSSMDNAITSLMGVIDNLLELTRIDKTDTLNLISVHVPTLLEKLISDYSAHIQANGNHVVVNMPAYLPELTADEQHIRLILENLIENAIRYTPADGTVTIRGASTTDAIQLQIQDTGIGIAQEDQDKIFERFYRTDDAQIHTNKGSGLGLAIVKKIVTRHDGTIVVDSEVGVGTTFTVSLPLRYQAQSKKTHQVKTSLSVS
ncbi:MAG: HAMP domain-containing sensor histidine kinase [Chloroflexota bacterium]